MAIKWNEVTWYSKFGAVILFLVVVPAITFNIGRQYENTLLVINQNIPSAENFDTSRGLQNVAASSDANLSGINGLVTLQGKPYSTNLLVKNSSGKMVTETVSGKNGKFLITLNPGKYTIEPSRTSYVKVKVTEVTVTSGVFTSADIILNSSK